MQRKLYTFILHLAAAAATTTLTRAADLPPPPPPTYAAKSVLSEGKWIKISVRETGFHKLTYAQLKKIGFPDPEKVSVHGYGGWPLNEDFARAEYTDDLPSIPLWRAPDFLLFYAKGTIKWHYDAQKQLFTHENNAYATLGYYFITDATETNPVTTLPPPENADTLLPIDTYDDYTVHEKEEIAITTNAGRPYSGRELFGESFDLKTSRDFPFSIPGITNDPGKITYRFIAKVKSGTGTVTLSANNHQLTQASIYQNDSPYTAALSASETIDWEGPKNENTTINITFSLAQQTSHLDYIRLQMKRRLQPYGPCTHFRSIESINRKTHFTIHNTSPHMLLFDVTDANSIRLIETTHTPDQQETTFTIPAANNLREFALLDPTSAQLPEPAILETIETQNLHGLPQTDMIILSPKPLLPEAEKLAALHRSHDQLTVAVITPEQIYNEFSSGGQEATAIRRFMKMLYDRRTSDNDAPKHLLLFGDGRSDNRKLTRMWEKSDDNYIVTYQSRETIGESSYVSDDYFGFLHDLEGEDPLKSTLQIGIGRIPVNTLTQARNAVEKITSYITNPRPGPWKNTLCFVADDGNLNDANPNTHMEESNTLANYIETNFPEYIPRKIFFDSYRKSNSGGKPTYPDVRTNIQKSLKDGVLIINYTGHGDPESWAEEKVMTQSDINNATYPNLPLWITASCDFAPFDATSSAGEDVFLNRKSGGIALFTTARVAYSDTNLEINKLFLQNLFEKKNHRHQTLGEVMKNAKNAFKNKNSAYQNRKIMSFFLLGDPAMTLAYPDAYHMQLTEINGQSLSEKPVNIKAFEKITLKGTVNTTDDSTTIAEDFNGLLSVTVFDSRQQKTTLNNFNLPSDPFTYLDYPNTIYTGNDSVRNGAFSFTFTVPKDISYSYQNGKINLYASDKNNSREANGSFKNFTVGGTDATATADLNAPEIRAIYLNTTAFKNGDKVNETPLFAAVVWDENGINVGGSGIGHDITLTIDNNPTLNYVLNSYYETYLEGGTPDEGIIRFPIPKLEPGRHSGEFKVWDTHNNSTTHTFDFVVADNYKPTILHLTAGPSPAKTEVNFMISHDLPESLIEVQIQVFDLAGRLQWKHHERGSSTMFNSYLVNWPLTDNAGVRLRPGVYIYRALVSNNRYNETSKAGKLIILAQ
jgi:hypothetical protein